MGSDWWPFLQWPQAVMEISALIAGVEAAEVIIEVGIRSAIDRPRKIWLGTAKEQVVEDQDRIGQYNLPIVIGICCVHTPRLGVSTKKPPEHSDTIAYTDNAIGIPIATKKQTEFKTAAIGISAINITIKVFINTGITTIGPIRLPPKRGWSGR